MLRRRAGRAGTDSVAGVEVIEDVVHQTARGPPPSPAKALPLVDGAWCDGALPKEASEDVATEEAKLSDVRVLRSGGHLALLSPNRRIPIEGQSVPLMPRCSVA